MKCAFTLAEVLITLAIVGIVAVLIIPNLILEHRERVTENLLKQSYSILSQALQRAEEKYGEIEGWYYDGVKVELYRNRILEQLDLANGYCDKGSYCFSIRANGVSYYGGSYFRLKNGVRIIMTPDSSEAVPFDGIPRLYFMIITSGNPPVYSGKDVFQLGIMNLKNLDIKAHTISLSSPGSILTWGNSPITCYNDNSSWNNYSCFIKFARDGYKFTKEYDWRAHKGAIDSLNNMLNVRVKGW